MAPAQRLGFERARPSSGQGVVARHLAERTGAWNRHQVWKILTAIVVIWIVSATALRAERGTNPAFETLGESLWNLWVTLFSGLEIEINSPVGRLVVSAVLVVGVALAGLFTASVASILIERALRSREVPNLEMSDHLVLCNWSPRALDWIREVHSGIVADKRPVVIVHDTRRSRAA